MNLNIKLDLIQNNKFINYFNNILEDDKKEIFLNNIIELGFSNFKHLVNINDPNKIVTNEITLINKINKNINKSLGEIKILFNKNSSKCNLGENLIEEYFKDYELTDTSGKPHSGDYQLKVDNLDIMIESKYYTNVVPLKEIEKLKFDMNHCGYNYGIMVSFNSNIYKKNNLSWEIKDGRIILFISNALDNNLLPITIHILKNLINLVKTNNINNININQFADNAYENISDNLNEMLSLKTNINKIKNNILTLHENTSKQILNLYQIISTFDLEYTNKLEKIKQNIYNEFKIINKNIKNLEINNINEILDKVITSDKELLSNILTDLSNMNYIVKLDKKIIIILLEDKEIGSITVLKSKINIIINKIKISDINIKDWINYKQLLK